MGLLPGMLPGMMGPALMGPRPPAGPPPPLAGAPGRREVCGRDSKHL